MSSTFEDIRNNMENNAKPANGHNPFDVPSSATDPFGISTNMKLSESSEKFDDNPFIVDTNKDNEARPRSGKDALSSSNWLAYQHSMDESNFDVGDDARDKSSMTQSNNDNSMNPFSTPTTASKTDQSHDILFQVSSMSLLYDSSKDSNTTFPPSFNNTFTNFNEISSTNKSTGNELSTDMTHRSTSATTDFTDFFASQLAATTGTKSPPKSNDPFLDYFMQPNNNILDVNSKTHDTNSNSSRENISSKRPLHTQCNAEIVVPSIVTSKQQTKFSSTVESKSKLDDDSDEESKMIFKIKDKQQVSSNEINMPVPLLPPPPTLFKSYNKSDDNGDSSSESEANDQRDDDPFAIFQSKPSKTETSRPLDGNLFLDWNETETKSNEQPQELQEKSQPTLDYYLHEPDYDDSAPLELYHNDINELQLKQLNGWLLQIRVPLRQKDLYKSTFQRFSETRTWQECYVRIFFDEKKLRFYLPQTIEQSFAEISLETWYQCTKIGLQQYDQYSKIHTFKIFEPNYHEVPQVRIDRLVTLPEKLLRKFTRPNKAQQVLFDHANCIQQEIVKFGQLNYTYLKQFSIILDDLFWSMPVTRSRIQKHLKEEITIKILDEYCAHIDIYRHICKHKSRTRLFILAFLNDAQPVVEIGMNDWFRHGKEVNKRNEIIINKTLQEYWIKPEQVELASIIDKVEYDNTHLLKLIPPDSQKIEIMRFRTRPKQNIELPLQVYCFMSVINRQVNIRIEVTVSNAFNISLMSKASSMVTNNKTAQVHDDNSDEQCPCENIQIRFPIPDAWVYMFRVEKRFRYGAIHSVRRTAGKIKGLDRFMMPRSDGVTPVMAASVGVAKYEQAFRSLVWRIDQLPKRDQGAYKTHIFECKMSIPSYDPVPEKYDTIADVEYSMSQAFVSHCQIRSVAVPNAEEAPEKWIRPKSQFTYTIDIEYAFKEEEKKDFEPIEIDMKVQSMSQSETENNSHSDESD